MTRNSNSFIETISMAPLSDKSNIVLSWDLRMKKYLISSYTEEVYKNRLDRDKLEQFSLEVSKGKLLTQDQSWLVYLAIGLVGIISLCIPLSVFIIIIYASEGGITNLLLIALVAFVISSLVFVGAAFYSVIVKITKESKGNDLLQNKIIIWNRDYFAMKRGSAKLGLYNAYIQITLV